MPKPSLRKKESAGATAGTPIFIGIASGASPRFVSLATYTDANGSLSFRSNHFGKRQEIASPVDGTPLTVVDTPQDVSTAELHPALTKVGECDHCSSDLYATKATASEIAGLTGHCVMCAQDVTFMAQATDATSGTETVTDDVNDFSETPTEVAGDNTNHFDFSEMELVNIDDENEEASMARQDDQTAIAKALRAKVTASDEDNAHEMGEDAAEEVMEDDEDSEEEETSEDDESEGGEEQIDTTTEEEGDEFAEDEESEDETSEDEDMSEEEEASASTDTLVETTEAAPATPVETPETVIANDGVTVADAAIDDYQAVDIEQLDLTNAVLVPASETAAYVMLGATPALYLNKESASETVQAVWDKPQTLRHALTAAMSNSDDRLKTLATFGGRIVTVATSMRAYAKQTLDAYAAKAESEVASMTQAHSTRFERALSTAALGVVKRSFGPNVVDTITAGLVATLENHGVSNAKPIVLASLRDTMPSFLKTVLEQANALVQESDDVLSNTAEMVGKAAYPVELPEPSPVVEQASVTPTAPAAPSPKLVIETAAHAPQASALANMKRVVASLGGR